MPATTSNTAAWKLKDEAFIAISPETRCVCRSQSAVGESKLACSLRIRGHYIVQTGGSTRRLASSAQGVDFHAVTVRIIPRVTHRAKETRAMSYTLDALADDIRRELS